MEFNNLARLQYRYANLWMYASILISYSMEKWYDNHSPLIYSLNSHANRLVRLCCFERRHKCFYRSKEQLSTLFSRQVKDFVTWSSASRVYIEFNFNTWKLFIEQKAPYFCLEPFFKYKIMNSGDVF